MQDQFDATLELSLEVLTLPEVESFFTFIDSLGFAHHREYYERCVERQNLGELLIILARTENVLCGYTLLNWQPKYPYFKKCGLPEIQDLNVLRNFRRRGIGGALIQYCESLARDHGHEEIGIGVGLDFSFGAAQRLYARLGYIPDGTGVTYDRKQVAVGEFRPIDENLCLMMTKKLA